MSQHFHTETRTARKPHVCDLCTRRIDPGEKYRHGAGMDGTRAWTWKECAHCDALRDLAFRQWYDDEYGSDLIAEWEPDTIPHLRLKAQWKRKWRHLDGTLMPVPEVIWSDENEYGYRTIADVRAGAPIERSEVA